MQRRLVGIRYAPGHCLNASANLQWRDTSVELPLADKCTLCLNFLLHYGQRDRELLRTRVVFESGQGISGREHSRSFARSKSFGINYELSQIYGRRGALVQH